MPRSAAEWVLLLGSVLLPFLLVGIAEIAVRSCSNIDPLGNSEHLFIADAYGTSNGNAPNVEAISFGQTVYTDEYGFRIPKGGVPGDERKSEAVLILGDSIGFGPALEEADTFAGLLRARFPNKRIFNSSVIGYSTPDYRNVVAEFLPRHEEVKMVVLVYSLNDISSSSAQQIDRYLKDEKPDFAPEQEFTETLRSFSLLSDANDYLRSRSELYLLLRHRLLGTQLRDWKAVLQLYSPERAADLEHSVDRVAEIAAVLKQRSIPFIVVLCPFEHQLREPADPETQVPQRGLGELLTKHGVSYIDARPYFDAGHPSTDYFLAYDAAHFSALGHRVVADVISDTLRSQEHP
jgi:lysophospholipase L1-like esterase